MCKNLALLFFVMFLGADLFGQGVGPDYQASGQTYQAYPDQVQASASVQLGGKQVGPEVQTTTVDACLPFQKGVEQPALADMAGNPITGPETTSFKALTREEKTALGLWGALLAYDIEVHKILGPIDSESQEGCVNLSTFLKSFNPIGYPQVGDDLPMIPLTYYIEQLDPQLSLENWKVWALPGTTGVEFGVRSLDTKPSAVVAYHPGRKILLIGIRGTTGKLDIITDLALTGRPAKDVHPVATLVPTNARVPRGFLGYAQSMARPIYDSIKKLVPDALEPGTQVLISGHSLGGAAASIISAMVVSMSKLAADERVALTLERLGIVSEAANLPKFDLENIHLVTFGMPGNVGNQAYVDWLEDGLGSAAYFHTLNDPITKITTGYIPSIPFFGWLDAYKSGRSDKWVLVGKGVHVLHNAHFLSAYGEAIFDFDSAFPIFQQMTEIYYNQYSGGVSRGKAQGEEIPGGRASVDLKSAPSSRVSQEPVPLDLKSDPSVSRNVPGRPAPSTGGVVPIG